MNKVPTPELDKMLAVKDKSQVIGEFVDWLRENGFEICGENENMDDEIEDEFVYYPAFPNVEKMLAQYFEIDLDKCEKERQALLDSLRA